MKRQRIGTSAIPIVARPRPVLRPSTRLNQIHIVAPEFMSYKELVKVVGVDCEASPSSWRKAIDHSAETVVFFQVDLRGSTPRMCKSVRICQEEEKLVPSVYIGESLLSATYVKTIIGKRFLTDEDDLMKLLEHAGILQEDGEFFEENAEDGDGGHGEDEAGENEPLEPEPEPKRARVAEKPRVVLESTQSSGRRTTRSSTAAPVSQKAAEPKSSVSGGRQPVDLSPLLMMEKIDALPADDSLMAGDFDDDALPVADDDDNLPLGDDIPGSSKMEESGEETTDFLPEPEVNRAGAEVEETSGLEQALDADEDLQFETSLIGLIRAHPCLWHRNDPRYRRLPVKVKAWKTISESTGLSVDKCKKKWHSLSNCFRHACKRPPKDMRGAPFPEWTHARAMQFVKPFLVPGATKDVVVADANASAGISSDSIATKPRDKRSEAAVSYSIQAPGQPEATESAFGHMISSSLEQLPEGKREGAKNAVRVVLDRWSGTKNHGLRHQQLA
ncbi:uncharacterized protein LOC129585481 isoform X2 [Paramacrobiotus metropolitanus]|uniref:uncharacterized protein LOC129585481 isoform X2 n=1 Tax=Paramacrobiotus metropolitanus TaxID=2943436 RepID=UPI0024458F89|nr:uncharacterized protein LOC129585481 isoform X2 [Paramacrobiotus metropolitanus]